MEFAVDILAERPRPAYEFHLLQCRPLTSHEWGRELQLPDDVPEMDKVFSANKLVPQGVVSRINYIVYVNPECYCRIEEQSVKFEIGGVISRLNKRLEGERFILIGARALGEHEH